MDNDRNGLPARTSANSDVFALILKFTQWSLAWRLGAAVVAVILGAGVRYFFPGTLEGRLVYITLFPAVAAAAVVGGVTGGVLATFLSAVAAHVLIAPLRTNADMLSLAAFFFSCAIIIAITKLLRIALKRIAADELIRRSDSQLSQFVEQAPTAMAMFDRDMRYLATSRRYLEDFRLKSQIIGKSHYEIFPEIPEHWKENNRRALAGETFRSEREAFTRGDGSVQWVRWEIRPWRDPRGEIGGIIIFCEEISESVRSLEELRASEEALRQSQHQLSLFIEHAPAAIAMFDRDMRYLAFSARWRDDYHLERDAVGKSHCEVFPEIPEQWKEIHRCALAGEVLRSEEDAFRRIDGSMQWLRWEVRPWRDINDGIGGVIIFSEDITEKKRVDVALSDSLKEVMDLKAALDEHAAVTIADPNGMITYANDKFCAESKYAREELLGQNHRILKSGFHPPELFRELWTTIASGRVWRAEVKSRAKDGSFYWAATTIVPFLDQLGKPRHYVAIRADITERVSAQAALCDSERRLKAVFDTAMEGIITVDKSGVIQAANPAAREMFGYEIDEMLGRNAKMLMPEPAASMHDGYIAHYLRGYEAMLMNRRRVVEGRRKNGEVFPKELTLTEASINQDVLFIGFMRDMTQIEHERHNAEAARAELLHVARLSDMGEVAAGLAHEVSQPLTTVLALAAAARRKFTSEQETPVAQTIRLIEQQARAAADILKRLRGFIEKRESQRYPENLTQLIQDALALASVRVSGRQARIAFKLSPDDIDVNVDRVQILQVLVNFLRNASDAMADQAEYPELVIETTTAKPGIVRVNVSDNGPGIDPKVADRLFTPFVTTKTLGMGVGLSLCKTIIEGHGGKIGAAANAPRGATFWFTLPMVERTETDDAIASAASGAID